MTSRIISGDRTAESIAREYLNRQLAPALPANNSGSPAVFLPVSTQPTDQSQNQIKLIGTDFYTIPQSRLIAATSADYRKFLKESGYADLDFVSGLHVAKEMLKWNPIVRNAVQTARLNHTGADNAYVVNINQIDARNLIELEDNNNRILTTCLMYKVFIPYIKDLVSQGNQEAQATLYEMINTNGEWLEDRILTSGIIGRGKKVQIGSISAKEKTISLARSNGYFDRADLNDFGYPKRKKDVGEHNYLAPNAAENAVFRDGYSCLYLSLNWEPSFMLETLGVRVAKFF